MSSEPIRLKTTQVTTTRASMLSAQGGRCALCGLPLKAEQAVLDHDHQTGAVRAALHRGCNSLLGKIENNHRRYGVANLPAFLHGAVTYLHRHTTNQTGLLHPSHKTDEEKRLARNKAARLKRASNRKEAHATAQDSDS